MDRLSLFKISGLPDSFGVILLVLCLILLLAPYFSGADFGLFKIPTVTESAKKLLKIIGPVLFLFCVVCFLPIFPGNKQNVMGGPTLTPSPPEMRVTPSPELRPKPGPRYAPQSPMTSSPNPHEELRSLIFDFVAAAPKAKWTSGFGANLLTWGSTAEDSKGFVRYMNNPTLEDGSRPQSVLFTHPEMKDEGQIVGDFTLREGIQMDDRFKGQVGFLAGGGGEVEFVVEAYGGSLVGNRRIYSARDNGNDGLLRTIDVDLRKAAGATAIRLIVNAEHTPGQDWAVWLNLRIER